MKKILNISLAVLGTMLLLFTSCSKWTQPQNLDFRHKTPEELDPAVYENYLSGIREYKKTEHKLMFVTMKGSADHPSSQNQHLMAMPDSADFVIVDINDALHSTLTAEIPQIRERKGTEALLFVDYARIHTAWGLLEDKRADEGKPAGTPEEAAQFFKEQTQKQLDRCGEYGFHGLVASFVGNTATEYAKASHEAFIATIKAYCTANPQLKAVFRGSARNVVDTDFLKICSHVIIVAGEEKKLTPLVGRILGRTPANNNVVMELTVPTVSEPEQKGASLSEGAAWVLSEVENKTFKACGLAAGNAYDDYFNKNYPFCNVRKAISQMNPSQKTE